MKPTLDSARLDINDIIQILRFTIACLDNCLDKDFEFQGTCTHGCLRLLNNTVNYVGPTFMECPAPDIVVAGAPTFSVCMNIILGGFSMLFNWLFNRWALSAFVLSYFQHFGNNFVPNWMIALYNFCQSVGPIIGIITFIIVLIKMFL